MGGAQRNVETVNPLAAFAAVMRGVAPGVPTSKESEASKESEGSDFNSQEHSSDPTSNDESFGNATPPTRTPQTSVYNPQAPPHEAPQPGPRTPRTSIHETVQQGGNNDDATAWMSTISAPADVAMGAHAADAEEVQIYAMHDDADEAEVEITIGSN